MPTPQNQHNILGKSCSLYVELIFLHSVLSCAQKSPNTCIMSNENPTSVDLTLSSPASAHSQQKIARFTWVLWNWDKYFTIYEFGHYWWEISQQCFHTSHSAPQHLSCDLSPPPSCLFSSLSARPDLMLQNKNKVEFNVSWQFDMPYDAFNACLVILSNVYTSKTHTSDTFSTSGP